MILKDNRYICLCASHMRCLFTNLARDLKTPAHWPALFVYKMHALKHVLAQHTGQLAVLFYSILVNLFNMVK